MEKIKQITEQLNKIQIEENEYNFPRMLLEMRKCFGITRRSLCREIDIEEIRMHSLETGTFYGTPKEHEINQLSEYYGINRLLLEAKARIFVADRRG